MNFFEVGEYRVNPEQIAYVQEMPWKGERQRYSLYMADGHAIPVSEGEFQELTLWIQQQASFAQAQEESRHHELLESLRALHERSAAT